MVVLPCVSTTCDVCMYYARDRALEVGIPIPTPSSKSTSVLGETDSLTDEDQIMAEIENDM
jgi:hypothetical protein